MTEPSYQQLSRFVHSARLADMPPAVIAAAKVFLMDSLAVGVAGSAYEGSEMALQAARCWGSGGSSRIIGRGGVVLPAPSAALINGYQIHCLEWDGLHEHSVVIAMCASLGALTADVDQRPATDPASGADLLEAFITGVEVAVLFGAAAASGPRFFRPAVAGLMGAAMAIGKLRGFDERQLQHCLGLAYCQAQGTMQAHWEGSMALAMQVGFAARAAITAADLVAAGVTGPVDVIDGKFGYFTLIEMPGDLPSHLAALGNPWKITQMAHKPFPAGRAAQATLTVLSELQAAHGFSADDVASVEAFVPPLIMLLVGRPLKPDMSPAYARLCLRFVGPLFLLDGEVNPKRFTPAVFTDPALTALSARFAITLDDNQDPNALAPQRIVVTLKSGTRFDVHNDAPLGAPDHPLLRAGQIDKLSRCFAQSDLPPDPQRLVTLCDTVEHLADARVLLDTITI